MTSAQYFDKNTGTGLPAAVPLPVYTDPADMVTSFAKPYTVPATPTVSDCTPYRVMPVEDARKSSPVLLFLTGLACPLLGVLLSISLKSHVKVAPMACAAGVQLGLLVACLVIMYLAGTPVDTIFERLWDAIVERYF